MANLVQSYRSGAVWATQALGARPAHGSALVATTAAAPALGHLAPSIPEVFYFDQRGRLAETYERGATWLTRTLPGPSSPHFGSLALADAASDGHLTTYVFFIDGRNTLTVASSMDPPSSGARWHSTSISSANNVSPVSRLGAITTGPGANQVSVFSIGADGRLAAATSGAPGGTWTVSELPATPAPYSTLLAANYALPSGGLGEDVFYLTRPASPPSPRCRPTPSRP